MNPSLILDVFIRDFRKQKKRITLTLVALTWGTISIMLLLGFGEGLTQQLTINSRGMGEKLAVLWGGTTSKPYKGFGKGRPIWMFTEEDLDLLKRTIPEMKYVAGEYSRWGVTARYGETVLSEHVNGITPEYEVMRNHIPQQGGRMINVGDMQAKRRVTFLGHSVAGRLFKDENPVGKSILLNGVPFTVVGVEIKKMQMNSYSGQDADKISIPLTTFGTVFGDLYLDCLIYQPHDIADMKLCEQRVHEVLGAKYKFDPTDERALSIWDVAASDREMSNILLGIQIFLGIIGGLTLLIAGVGVANIMYVSIKERTREIGIKMAVGARRSHILWQFLLESLVITFSGGLLGMLITIGLTEGFKSIPIESEVLDFMGRPTISLEIGVVVVTILGLMGLLSGLFPAMRAASVSPVESLRYE